MIGHLNSDVVGNLGLIDGRVTMPTNLDISPTMGWAIFMGSATATSAFRRHRGLNRLLYAGPHRCSLKDECGGKPLSGSSRKSARSSTRTARSWRRRSSGTYARALSTSSISTNSTRRKPLSTWRWPAGSHRFGTPGAGEHEDANETALGCRPDGGPIGVISILRDHLCGVSHHRHVPPLRG